MEDRVQFISEFKTVARRKGTTPDELFNDNDKDHTGRIRYETFRKLLSSINMWVREDRIESLTRPYIQGRDFLYADFMKTDDGSNNDSDPAIEEDIAEFGKMLTSRAIYLQDTLEEKDRYHSGYVTDSDFYRTFGCNPLTRRIAQIFNNGHNQVEYLKLANSIRKLQKERKVVSSQLQTTEKRELPSFFSVVVNDINSQSVDPMSTFISLDRLKKGLLPKKVFLNALYGFNLHINAGQLVQLVEVFARPDGNVQYSDFCDEVQKSIASMPPPERKTVEIKGDINKTMAYLRDVEKNRHSQLGEQFKLCDPRGTGYIQSTRFLKALEVEKFPLSKPDRDVLLEHFGDQNGYIKYDDFLRQIVPPTNQITPTASQVIQRLKNHLESHNIYLRPKLIKIERDTGNQLHVIDLLQVLHAVSFDFSQREWNQLVGFLGPLPQSPLDYDALCDEVDPPVHEVVAPPEPEVNISSSMRTEIPRECPPDDILQTLIGLLRSANKMDVDFYQQFRSNDYLRQGVVPKSQFQSIVLSVYPSLQPQLLAHLIEFYKAHPPYVNYGNMIKDMNQFATDALQEMETKERTITTGPSDESNIALRKIKSHLDAARIDPEQLFANYDPGNNGLINKARLSSVFVSIDANLLPSELESLQNDFEDKRRPEFVNYKRIAAAIRGITLSHNDLSSIRIRSLADQGPDREVAVLLNSLRERIQQRHKRVRDAFIDCVPGQPCSSREFRAALQSFGLIIREIDVLKILKFYRVTRVGDVDWEKFCHDIETSKTVEMV